MAEDDFVDRLFGFAHRLARLLERLLFWRRPSKRRLTRVIDAHQLWFSSRTRQGSRAILSGANLKGVRLAETDLRGADLSGTNLREANLKDALVTADQLASAILDETTALPDGSNPKGG